MSGVYIPNFIACSSCDNPIYPEEEYVKVNDDYYHKKCFDWEMEQVFWQQEKLSWEDKVWF